MVRPTVSEAAELLYAKLFPHTIEDEANEWHLLKFCDAIATAVFEKSRSYVADRDDMKGWTVLFNVDLCPNDCLPYLAQYVGVELEPGLTEQQRRDKIRNRPGFARGSVGAITSAAQLRLTGTKIVVMFERFEGDAYRLLMRTYEQQTPDPVGTENDIRKQKPAGIVLDFEVIPGKIYATTKIDYPKYSDRTAVGSYEKVVAP